MIKEFLIHTNNNNRKVHSFPPVKLSDAQCRGSVFHNRLYCWRGKSGMFPSGGPIRPLPSSLPGGSEVKVSACNAGDLGSIPGSGRSPGEGNGNPLQYSCLENPMGRGAWWATVHGVAESNTTERLHFHFHTFTA